MNLETNFAKVHLIFVHPSCLSKAESLVSILGKKDSRIHEGRPPLPNCMSILKFCKGGEGISDQKSFYKKSLFSCGGGVEWVPTELLYYDLL